MAAETPARTRCPETNVSIPECSCRACCEALVRKHAPWLLHDPPPAAVAAMPRPEPERADAIAA